MRRQTLVVVFLLVALVAHARLTESPSISVLKTAKDNPNVVYLHIAGYIPAHDALSVDAGATFTAITEAEIPAGLTADSGHGARRYVLVDDARNLLRTDDNGATWRETSIRKFIRDQVNAMIKEEKDYCKKRCGARMPERADAWHVMFCAFLGVDLLLLLVSLRSQGWLKLARTCLQLCMVMALLWGCLFCLHEIVMHQYRIQWPSAYWCSTSGFHPTAKLGLLLGVAAKPLPLLVYLAVLWPLLPGTIGMMRHWFGRRPKLLLSFELIALVCGALFVAFHLWIFIFGRGCVSWYCP